MCHDFQSGFWNDLFCYFVIFFTNLLFFCGNCQISLPSTKDIILLKQHCSTPTSPTGKNNDNVLSSGWFGYNLNSFKELSRFISVARNGQISLVSLSEFTSVPSQTIVLSSDVAHHAWVQASGAGIRRRGKICTGEWWLLQCWDSHVTSCLHYSLANQYWCDYFAQLCFGD